MGFLTRLVTLPLLPAEGVIWVARKLEEQADMELYGPESIRRQLADLAAAVDSGQISEDVYLAEEEVLLDRLDDALGIEVQQRAVVDDRVAMDEGGVDR